MLLHRKSLRYAATVLALSSLAACSSKEDAAPEPSRGITWTVDGKTATTTTLQSQKSGSSLLLSGTYTNGSTTSYLMLNVPATVGTYPFGPTSEASGTYSVGSGTALSAVYYAGATGSGTVLGAGTIVVSALTATSATGTFTFTGINSNTGAAKSLTDGTFNVGL